MLPAAAPREDAGSRSRHQSSPAACGSFIVQSNDASMSSKALPDSVGAGTVVCDLHLTSSDAQQFVDRLRVAVERLVATR